MQEKIDYSMTLVAGALAKHRRPVVACSFGKDSVATLHLVRQLRPEVDVVFINTGVEFLETVRFARRLAAEWKLNLTIARPERGFWSIVSEHGFPLRTRGSGSTHGPGRRGNPDLRRQSKAADVCCDQLKKRPMKKLIAERGWDLLFDGVTAAENELRRMQKFLYGDYHFVKSWGLAKCHPIQDWSAAEVWEYHRRHGLPHNPLYDKQTAGYQVRTGCWCCTIPVRYGKLRFLREHYPALWRHLLLKKGLASQLIARKLELEASEIDEWVVRDYVANYPCFFDRVE